MSITKSNIDTLDIDYEEYLTNIWCDPSLILEEMVQFELDNKSLNGTPEERHLILYELHLFSNEL